ncbi:MAG: hypothetical protein KF824_02790 [Fimbriimonadaceae bacterium]|nr:MAG: hypothetical protein KF824_02790 [Fimbriimonadaceae bacterium]
MDELIPIVAIMMVFGIPIAAILTHHQRKMAELIHGKQAEAQQMNPAIMHEIQSLRGEVARLRDQVNSQTLELEDLRSPHIAAQDMSQRLGD